jgi:hypothetical protein
MPEFGQGSNHIAKATMTNPTTKSFDYNAILYMGIDQVAMDSQSFHLGAGISQDISFPVTMPVVVGTYPVYLTVFSDGVLINHYRATEDVTIFTVGPGANIIAASWQLIDFPFVGYWPEETGTLYATFCKCTLQIESDSEFVGSVKMSTPNLIAPVPLLTAYGFQELMAELDRLIAESAGFGSQQLWIARKALASNFPKIGGFTIDYRWYGDTDRYFRDWIYGNPVESFTLKNVYIPEGVSSVEVGFFRKYSAAIGLFPVTSSLYSDDTLLTAIESNILPPESVPQLLGLTLPQSIVSGDEIPMSMILRLPTLTNSDYFFDLTIRYGGKTVTIAKVYYAPASMVATWLARGCGPLYLPLNAPNNTYNIAGIYNRGTGEWETGMDTVPLPPGVYSARLKGESWQIGLPSTGCGINYYGYDVVARYDFGIVGYIQVV